MKMIMKAEQLAEELKVSKQTIWRWGREGKIEKVNVGRTVRFYWEGRRDEEDKSY